MIHLSKALLDAGEKDEALSWADNALTLGEKIFPILIADKNNLHRDWWLQGDKNVDGLIAKMSNTLWVFARRNKLNEKILSRRLDFLPDDEARIFLTNASVDENFHDEIIKFSGGYPVFPKKFRQAQKRIR